MLLGLALTEHCNLRCPHCIRDDGPESPCETFALKPIYVDTRGRVCACCQLSQYGHGITADLVLGGQGTYVALRSSNVSYSLPTQTFRADVTVENLIAEPLGTPNGSTVTGVYVFFHSGPTVVGGTGTVTVANADGRGTFTSASEPYLLYDQVLQTGPLSAPRTWRWSVPATVTSFVFQVFVDAQLPEEHTVLRWRYDPTVDGNFHGAVWGASSNSVFAVGAGGKIVHFDGETWAARQRGETNTLRGVWGASASDVFAVGEGGTTLHFNGTAWGAQASGTMQPLYGVWGVSGSDVFAVGVGGTILHYNGTAWAAQPSGTANALYGIWAASGSDVFAVGGVGTIRH